MTWTRRWPSTEGSSSSSCEAGSATTWPSSTRIQPPDDSRHFGLVVDNCESVRAALHALDVEALPGRGLSFRDPWGNHVQVVQYGDIQFTKAAEVLRGMDVEGLSKSASAQRELRDKGLAG